MEEIYTIVGVILSVVLRFGIPVGLTALLIVWLKQVDKRWQVEAESKFGLAAVNSKNSGCWDVNKCTPEMRKKCQAYAHPEIPCWQFYRDREGYLQEKCLPCEVFRNAPVPSPA